MNKVFGTVFSCALISLSVALPVHADPYHQSYGDSRVVRQNQIGLYHNDASYVSCGTLGQSARDGGVHKAGIQTGSLPSTRWGGYIRNPGDDMYNGNNGAMRQDNGSMVYGDEVAQANYERRMMAQQKRMEMMMNMMQMRQRQISSSVPQGNLYHPGSNGAASNYASGVMGYSKYSQ